MLRIFLMQLNLDIICPNRLSTLTQRLPWKRGVLVKATQTKHLHVCQLVLYTYDTELW